LYKQNWVVYAKAPFGGAEQEFRYLGRYSHRVAIANSRLVSLSNAHVNVLATGVELAPKGEGDVCFCEK
jgi:hypothetical protein